MKFGNQKDMENKNKTDLNRRNFLKVTGAGAVAATAAMYGCGPSNQTPSEGGGVIGEVPTDKMTYRTNPHTGDKVSLLGYGCMRWPLRINSRGEEEVDQDAVNELIDYAIAHGVNFFDTAPRYVRGWSEPATGIALSRHSRDKYLVSTKMSNYTEQSFKDSIDMYQMSFKNLKVDYIDYYFLHNVGNGGMANYIQRFESNGLLKFLLKERESGRIRNLGFSFHGDINAFNHLLSFDIQWDFALIQLNYIDWQHATGNNTNAEYLFGELEKKNVPVMVMEPLLGGRLARVPARALNLMKDVNPNDTPAQWAFRYAANQESVLTVLSGMTYMEHLQENIRTYAPFKPLNNTEIETLAQVTDIMVDSDFIQCTTCQYCMPCPYGLDIPSIFDHYNRCVNAGRVLKSSTDENYRKARREFLVGYDRSVPKLRQASHCTGCKLCEPKCTQSLKISDEMRRIDKYVELLKQEKDF
jgi:predicted aldo/keto reductase-like oxidoreductase